MANNFYIDQGTDFSTIINLTNADGTPRDLTGASVASQIRRGFESTSFVSFNATVHNNLGGQIKLNLTNAQTALMKAGRYVYDVELTNSSGEKSKPLKGLIIIDPEVTR